MGGSKGDSGDMWGGGGQVRGEGKGDREAESVGTGGGPGEGTGEGDRKAESGGTGGGTGEGDR